MRYICWWDAEADVRHMTWRDNERMSMTGHHARTRTAPRGPATPRKARPRPRSLRPAAVAVVVVDMWQKIWNIITSGGGGGGAHWRVRSPGDDHRPGHDLTGAYRAGARTSLRPARAPCSCGDWPSVRVAWSINADVSDHRRLTLPTHWLHRSRPRFARGLRPPVWIIGESELRVEGQMMSPPPEAGDFLQILLRDVLWEKQNKFLFSSTVSWLALWMSHSCHLLILRWTDF